MKKKNSSQKKNKTKKIIVISIISFLIIAAAGFFVYDNFIKKDFRHGFNFTGNYTSGRRGNYTLSETTQNQITSFFQSSPSSSEVQDYCSQNPMYCGYYCRKINPNDNACTEVNQIFQNMRK